MRGKVKKVYLMPPAAPHEVNTIAWIVEDRVEYSAS